MNVGLPGAITKRFRPTVEDAEFAVTDTPTDRQTVTDYILPGGRDH